MSSVCITVGGKVRIQLLGPGKLSVSDRGKTTCHYEAAVHSCRLLYTGSLRFTAELPTGRKHLNVEIAAAVSPPRPSPACMSAGPFTYDIREEYIWVSTYCVKLGSVLTIVNTSLWSMAVNPPSAASCREVDAGRECRFPKAATVKFTFTRQGVADRVMYVVAIK